MTAGRASLEDQQHTEAASETSELGDRAGAAPRSTIVETRTAEPSEPSARRAPPRAIPQVRDGRYELLCEHGRGGIGCVYRAHDHELDRDVAIKKLISRGHLVEMRFFREAAITARLEHPGIVPVHEAGWWTDGTPFYAMKLIAGRPLRDLIAERPTVEQRLGLLHHVIAVADAIAYAHARKVIHRDLKPSNVIVGEFGETVVIDWGLAKDLTTNESASDGGGPVPERRDDDLTSAGGVLGTPAYMAPEQQRGEAVDQRADVFAIGMMLWQLCALDASPRDDPHQRRAVLRRGRVDDDLIAIIDKAIAGDPQHRYRDAGALVTDLRAFTSGARIAARRYSPLAVVAHWLRRHRMLAISAATGLALLALAVRALLYAWVTERLADLSITQAEVEAGRQALLHDDTEEAQRHLARAYLRGEHSPSVGFMLSRALQPRLAEQAHFPSVAGRMWSAAFSPDGRRVVTTDDTAAQVWDADTHRKLFTLAHGSEVHDAVYAANGARIVTAARGAVRIWEAASGALVRALTPPADRGKPTNYYYVARSRDDKLVAAIDSDGAIADVWDASSGALVAELRNDSSGYPSIAFTGDGRWLVTSGGDDVLAFDTRTWARAMTLPGQNIRTLDIDSTAPRLIAGTGDGGVGIWAIPSGERIHSLRQLGDPIWVVAFAPDGARVAAGTREGTVQVWDAASGELQSTSQQLHSKIQSLAFDRTSTLVVAGGASGKVLVEDAARGMPLAVLEGPRTNVWARFDPSALRVVGASWDGTAWIWAAASPYLRWRSPARGNCHSVTNLDPDRRFLPVSCEGRTTQVWDTAQDRLLAELPGTTMIDGDFTWLPAVSAAGDRVALARDHAAAIHELPGGRPVRTIVHGAVVTAVGFATTGHDVISGAIDGSVLVTRDGSEPVVLPGFAAGVDAAGFLADGRPMAAAGRQLRIYDAARRTVLAEFELPARVETLRSSPDGHRLVTSARWNDAPMPSVLWDVERYRQIGPLVGTVGTVWSARFVRGGREVLIASGDSTVRSWDAASGRLLHTYRGSGARFMADATLDPEGTMIVAAGGDGLIHFWDAVSERPLWTLVGHKPHAIGVHFEGQDLVTRGFDGDVARWALPRPDLDAMPELLRELAK